MKTILPFESTFSCRYLLEYSYLKEFHKIFDSKLYPYPYDYNHSTRYFQRVYFAYFIFIKMYKNKFIYLCYRYDTSTFLHIYPYVLQLTYDYNNTYNFLLISVIFYF